MAELRNRPRKELFQLRITPELRERADAVGARDNRGTTTATLSHLIELGLRFDSMTEGPGKDLILDLFVGARMSAEAGPVMILDSIKKHFPREALIEAVDNFRNRLVDQ